MILETYTTAEGKDFDAPPFLEIDCEITDHPLYSMHNLSLKDYHNMEIKAGATESTDTFDYRHIYAQAECSENGIGVIEFQ